MAIISPENRLKGDKIFHSTSNWHSTPFRGTHCATYRKNKVGRGEYNKKHEASSIGSGRRIRGKDSSAKSKNSEQMQCIRSKSLRWGTPLEEGSALRMVFRD